MGQKQVKYIPALRFSWLTKLFDPFLRFTMPEFTFKRHLLEKARIKDYYRVLDLGCGTATLSLLIKRSYPSTEVIGLDGDPEVLEIAREKVQKTGLALSLDYGMAFDLPYPDNSFDRVSLSSFNFRQ